MLFNTRDGKEPKKLLGRIRFRLFDDNGSVLFGF